MIRITQNKIAGFETIWAPFSGFSLLFDNPGASLSTANDSREIKKIRCVCKNGGDLDLYFRLDKALAEIGHDYLFNNFLFCSLPTNSYHVTVWDGINVGNISSVRVNVRRDWEEFLRNVPDSLLTPPESIHLISESQLMQTAFGSIKFRFENLYIWKDQVLVARLCSADESSESRFGELLNARKKLSEAIEDSLDIKRSGAYKPHVSLGYFANKDYAQLAGEFLHVWREIFQKYLCGAVLSFSSIGIYGFINMTEFFVNVANRNNN